MGRSGRGCGRPGRCRRITSVPASFSECLLVAFDPERHTGAVSNGELQGSHADPFGLHEIRYFSAGRPTKLVRDGRVEAYDEPPAEEYTSAAVAVGAPAGGDPDATSDGPSIQSAPGSFRAEETTRAGVHPCRRGSCWGRRRVVATLAGRRVRLVSRRPRSSLQQRSELSPRALLTSLCRARCRREAKPCRWAGRARSTSSPTICPST